MSSPTISVPEGGSDTSLQAISELIRSIINDTLPGLTSTPGEGQIWTNNDAVSPFVQPLLNSAIRSLYRQLRLAGDPQLIRDNVILNAVPPLNSPLYGIGSPDPAIQVSIGYEGYFDGTTINPNILLPGDVLYMERLWERQTGTTNLFCPMTQPEFGLPSVQQGPSLVMWEWRNQKIWMCGSTQTRDLRLRYYCSLPRFFSATLDFASTYVPIVDCTDAVAYLAASKYDFMTGSTQAKEIQAQANEEVRQLKLEHVRRSQSINYDRPPYGDNSGTWQGSGGNNFGFGWQ